MEPTVLAGAIEFSPAEIALFLAVLAALALLVTAPGWVVLGVAAGRRPGPDASPGRRWAARLGGAVLGMVISAAVTSVVGAALDQFSFAAGVGVPAAWAACWVVAYTVGRPSARPGTGPTTSVPEPAEGAGEGWGR